MLKVNILLDKDAGCYRNTERASVEGSRGQYRSFPEKVAPALHLKGEEQFTKETRRLKTLLVVKVTYP